MEVQDAKWNASTETDKNKEELPYMDVLILQALREGETSHDGEFLDIVGVNYLEYRQVITWKLTC